MNEQVPLSRLNTVEREPLVQLRADIFEHSQWIPYGAWSYRPFESISDLHSKMVKMVEGMELYRRMTLIARDGVICKGFYPMSTPGANVEEELAWLDTDG